MIDPAAYLETRDDFGPGPFRAEELSGGNLNYVWRVVATERLRESRPDGKPRRLRGGDHDRPPARFILKHAPPFAARRPEIALDPDRLTFEARALALLNALESPALDPGVAVRVPRVYAYDRANAVLIMEDLGAHPDLGRVLETGDAKKTPRGNAAIDFRAYGVRLGEWLAGLHSRTGDDAPGENFRNVAVQERRNRVQYLGAREYLRQAGVADADSLGDRAGRLGRRLLEPGICLVMGDLWPASLLISREDIGVIDWEFAHYGRPVQDVAHLSAHLYMRALRGMGGERERAIAFASGFLDAYLALAPATRVADLETDAGVHFGCEILMRTAGPFQAGYLFEGLRSDDSVYRGAIEAAAKALRDSRWELRSVFR